MFMRIEVRKIASGRDQKIFLKPYYCKRQWLASISRFGCFCNDILSSTKHAHVCGSKIFSVCRLPEDIWYIHSKWDGPKSKYTGVINAMHPCEHRQEIATSSVTTYYHSSLKKRNLQNSFRYFYSTDSSIGGVIGGIATNFMLDNSKPLNCGQLIS